LLLLESALRGGDEGKEAVEDAPELVL
jgi:hypothetical protein